MKGDNDDQPFAMTIAGFLVPMFSGLISTFCSSVILYIIKHSVDKLSSPYHRLVTVMSIFYIITSIFISLGTIMMPKDNIYKFEGPVFGNDITCKLQGWLVVFGASGGGSLYMCLSWYFALKISFKMDSDTITRKVEPLFYLYSLFSAAFIPSFFLAKDLFHPNPFESRCIISPYSENCDGYDLSSCDWDDDYNQLRTFETSIHVTTFWIFVTSCLFLAAMILISLTMHRNNKKLESTVTQQTSSDGSHLEPYDNQDILDLRYSRLLVIQVFLYIFAYIITWIFTLLYKFVHFDTQSFVYIANAVLFPLTGFWNLLIFVLDKAYLVRQSEELDSFWEASKIVLFSPHNIPSFVVTINPRLSMAHGDHSRYGRLHSQLNIMNVHPSNGSSSSSKQTIDVLAPNSIIPNSINSVEGLNSYVTSGDEKCSDNDERKIDDQDGSNESQNLSSMGVIIEVSDSDASN